MNLAGESTQNPFSVHEQSAPPGETRGFTIDDLAMKVAIEGRPVSVPPQEIDGEASLTCARDRSPLLEILDGNIASRWRMRRSIALIGRDPACSAWLDCPSLSRFHCSLVLTRLGLWVVDLLGEIDSPAHRGIYVNGERVRFARLDTGDVLRVGRLVVRTLAEPGLDTRRRKVETSLATTESDPMIALRHQFEARLAAEEARHHVEVEALRNQLKSLHDQLAQVQPATGPRWEESANATLASGGLARPLGSALRLESVPSLPMIGSTREGSRTTASPRRLGCVSVSVAASPVWIPSVKA